MLKSQKKYIDRTAKCGKGKFYKISSIGRNVEIGKGGEFGDKLYIGPNTMLGRYVKVPKKFKIGRGVCIEDKVSFYDKRFRGMKSVKNDVAVFAKSSRKYKRPKRGKHFVLVNGKCREKAA